MKQALLTVLLMLLVVVLPAQKKKTSKQAKPAMEQFASIEQYRQQSGVLLEAVKERLSGNITQSETLLQGLLLENPNYDLAHFEYAKLLLIRSKTQEAIEELNLALALNDTNAWFKELLAESYDKINAFSKSEKLWLDLAKKYPQNIDYLYKYSLSLIYQNKYKEAVEAYNMMELQMGVSEDITIAKRNIWLQMNKPEKALEEMEKLAAENPYDARYYIEMANMCNTYKMPQKSIVYLEKAKKIDPSNPHVNVSLYNNYLLTNEQEKAFEQLKKAFSATELGVDEKIKILYRLYQDKKQTEKAYVLLDSLLKAHPQEQRAWHVYADFLIRDVRLAKAKEALEKVLEFDKTSYAVWKQYLAVLASLNLKEELYFACEEAIELFPTQTVPYYFKASSSMAMQYDVEEIIQTLVQGMELCDDDNLKNDYLFLLAESYQRAEQWENMKKSFEALLQKQPQNADVLNSYAYALAEIDQNLDYALDLSTKANRLKANDCYYQDTHAWIYYKLKDYANALLWIEKALQNGGENDEEIVKHHQEIMQESKK